DLLRWGSGCQDDERARVESTGRRRDLSVPAERFRWHPADMPWTTAPPSAPPANGHVAGDADVARIAGLVGDPTRAAMLVALLDGRPRTAGGLGRLRGAAASTASGAPA